MELRHPRRRIAKDAPRRSIGFVFCVGVDLASHGTEEWRMALEGDRGPADGFAEYFKLES